MMNQAQQYDLLTLSGNEITDYVRTLPDQGDGLTNDGSTGVWPAATNRAINSNFKTNTTSFIDVGATTTRETSGLVGADTTRGSTVTANAATAEGTSQLISGGAASTQYTFSMWLAGTGTVKLYISDTVAGKQLGSQITLSATPTKYSVTATTGAASANWTVGFETDSQQAITVTHGRWMAQTGAIAMPHVLTDGATAASSLGKLQVPVKGLFTTEYGGVALRIRAGHSLASVHNFFSWFINANNRLDGDYHTGAFRCTSVNGGVGGDATQLVTVVAGDLLTFIIGWTPSLVYVSVNGAVRTSGARTGGAFSGLDLLADIGSQDGNNHAASTYLWAVFFNAPVEDSESAYLHSLGNAGPPRLAGLPRNAVALWDGVSGVFTRRR